MRMPVKPGAEANSRGAATSCITACRLDAAAVATDRAGVLLAATHGTICLAVIAVGSMAFFAAGNKTCNELQQTHVRGLKLVRRF